MVNFHQKRVRVNYHYFMVMENGSLPSMFKSGCSFHPFLYLLVTLLLFKSPSSIFGFVYNGEYIRYPPSHRWLRNRSYTLKFKISTFIYWSIYLLSHVLIPPLHTSDSYQYPCCPCSHLPYVPVVPLCCNGCLPWLEILGA